MRSKRTNELFDLGSFFFRCAIDEALKCKETGEAKTILFGLTGTGYFDMSAYVFSVASSIAISATCSLFAKGLLAAS